MNDTLQPLGASRLIWRSSRGPMVFAAAALLGAGCLQSQVSGNSKSTVTVTSGGTSSAAGSSTGSPGVGSSSAALSSGSSTGATGGSSTGTGTGTGTTTGTGSGAPPPPIVDGGYVFCDASHGGPDHDGGPVSWLCPPGTYFCDLGDAPGNCFECRSDADCADRSLPTYDQKRPHCDVSSGVSGYQNFCQQCVSSADCAGNPAGSFCDVNSYYPASWLVPPIDLLGFETCGRILTDCRVDGGPPCGLNQACDPSSGGCVPRPISCSRDADCVGLVYNQDIPVRFCVGGQCNACPGGVCANGICSSDADCGGLWPVCEDAGPSGNTSCGCDDDQECGDAGLTCLFRGTGLSFCGLSCATPSAPPCPLYMACEPDSGICGDCSSDTECQESRQSSGPYCNGVYCGCYADADCPKDQTCATYGGSFGTCSVPLPHCTPGSCSGSFCDWDGGFCVLSFETIYPGCITDYDCSTIYHSAGDFCIAGQCVGCRDDNDCVVSFPGPAPHGNTLCCLPGDSACELPSSPPLNNCSGHCQSNADCIDNENGPTCVLYADAGYGSCEDDTCLSNADCAGNPYGSYCELDGGLLYLSPYGQCGCLSTSDCGPGLACLLPGFSVCRPYCYGNSDCAPGYDCDPSYICRPHCDDGGGCGGPNPICDTDNVQHQNGETLDGSVSGLIWCYGCLSSDDCPNGEGCGSSGGVPHGCGPCQAESDCASGACLNGSCLTACDAGGCPGGQVCDIDNLAGHGTNLCFQCLGPIDCPDGEGCNGATHLCGSCTGPTFTSAATYDCPPGEFCSNYWTQGGQHLSGACLQTCDDRPCPADRPICAGFPSLSPDHSFCFGCLSDADCAGAGPGAWCDTSVNLTFACQQPVGQ